MATDLAREVERRLHEEAELHIAVDEDEGRLVLTGLISSERERETALEVVQEVAPGVEVDDNLELDGALPDAIESLLPPEAQPARDDTEAGERTLEPGDFTDQTTIEFGDDAAGPTSSFEDDEAGSGAEVFVPPVDPVGTDRDVIGGLQTSSMEEVDVERSSGGELGDEAIRDAILQELREDAATTDLEIDVEVTEGRAVLSGHVAFVDDVENAEEVAGRVPGVVEVEDQLEVDGL